MSFGSRSADELHELVGLPVEVEVVQRLERERRVPHPRVAVVPVALASGGLGQGRGERGDRGPRGHVGQALDRQSRPLDGLPVGVVGDARPAQPGTPEPGRGGQAIARLLDVVRRCEAAGPRQRAVHPVARPEDVARPSSPALDAEGQVGLQPDGLTRRRWRRRCDGCRPPASTRRAPGRSRTPARTRARSPPHPSMHSAVRTSMWSASSSAGGRVCGVTSSSPSWGPMVSASRTTTQPPFVCHVVVRTLVPGS